MRRPVDLSVYLVLDPDLCHGAEGMIETACAAVENGATCVQLRAPHWKKRALVECGRALMKELEGSGVPLIVNDHADVCVAIGADGLHVGQNDLSPADARMIIGKDKILGLSVSNEKELAAVDTRLVDHLGIGPVFLTQTKTDTAAELCGPCSAQALPSGSNRQRQSTDRRNSHSCRCRRRCRRLSYLRAGRSRRGHDGFGSGRYKSAFLITIPSP